VPDEHADAETEHGGEPRVEDAPQRGLDDDASAADLESPSRPPTKPAAMPAAPSHTPRAGGHQGLGSGGDPARGLGCKVPASVPCCASAVNIRIPEMDARTPVRTVEKTNT
jgi:hypothetical protein